MFTGAATSQRDCSKLVTGKGEVRLADRPERGAGELLRQVSLRTRKLERRRFGRISVGIL